MSDIRLARIEDAAEAAGVMVRSITQLCAQDHGSDPLRIAVWTQNKTAESVRLWIESSNTTILVATRKGSIAAVGGVLKPASIVLNYVDPAYRFAGYSTQLLDAMEGVLEGDDAGRAHLESTRTARQFYRSRGWQEHNEVVDRHGIIGFRMSKPIT